MDNLSLEKVSREKVNLINSIVGQNREGFFEVDGKPCSFAFVGEQQGYTPNVCFDVRLSDHNIKVTLENLPPVGFFSKELEDVDLEALTQEVYPVVMESLIAPLLKEVQQGVGVRVAVISYNGTQDDGVEREAIHFKLNSQKDGLEFRGALHLDLPALEFLSTMLPPAKSRDDVSQSIELLSRLVVGRVDLSLSEFQGLEDNDLVLLQSNDFATRGACEIVFDNRMRFDATLENGTVTLGEIMDDADESDFLEEFDDDEQDQAALERRHAAVVGEDDQEENAEGSHEGEFRTGDIPIHLVFDVGEKRIPLQDFQSLQAGYTFELPTTMDAPVTIRANGRKIGKGKLVQVGDRLGVKVTKFNKA